MQRPLLLLGFCLSAAIASAQAPFATAYKDAALTQNYSHDYAQIAQGPSGHVVMVVDLSVTTGDRYIYALRCEANGTVQWMKRIDVIGSEMWDVSDIALLSDGSLVITGGDDLHGLFLRLDAMGDPVAARWYGWTGTTATTAVQVVNDSTIVLFGNNRQSGVSRGWTATVDADGDLLGPAVSFQVDGYELATTHPIPVSPTESMVLGRSDVYGSPADIGVAAGVIDTGGTIQWASRFSAAGMMLRPVGGMVLPDGSARLVVRNDGGFPSQSTVVIALDPAGAVQWTKELHPKRGSWDLNAKGVVPMSDTTFVVTGYYDPAHSGALLLDTAANVLGHESWGVVIITSEGYRDAGGELVLAAHTPVSGSFDPALMRTYPDLHLCTSAVTSCTTNSFALNVTSSTTTAPQSLSVVDILADFSPVTITPVVNEMCLTVGEETVDALKDDLMIFPQPATDRVTISGHAIDRVEILDAAGRMVLTRELPTLDRADLHIGDLATGLLLVRVRSAGAWRSTYLMKE